MSKRETVDEFLARGGSITKIAPQEEPQEEGKVTSASKSASSTMMTLADGGLYYAEGKVRKPRKKQSKTVDFSALPASLLKFLPSRDE